VTVARLVSVQVPDRLQQSAKVQNSGGNATGDQTRGTEGGGGGGSGGGGGNGGGGGRGRGG
jgi:hypothetical protein